MISLLSNHFQTNELDVPLEVATPVEWWRQYAFPTHSHHSPAHTSRFMVHTLATGSSQRGLAFHGLNAPMVSVGIDFCFYVLFDVTRRSRLVFVCESSLFFTHYLQSLYKLKTSGIVKTGNYFFLPCHWWKMLNYTEIGANSCQILLAMQPCQFPTSSEILDMSSINYEKNLLFFLYSCDY